MLAKINKKQFTIYFISLMFFVLAGILQYIDNDLPMIFAKTCNLVANLIFFLLVFIWSYSINNRIVKKTIRIKLIIISSLILLWLLLRYIKYECFNDDDIASRYLWYLYYVPQCLVPPIALTAILELTGKTSCKLSKLFYIIFIPSVTLIVLILTNDLHQLAFSFKANFENFGSDYNHEIVYYITNLWMLLVILSALVILFFKCSVSSCKRKIWIPIVVFISCIIISFLCYFFATRSYKVPELISFSFIILMESCVCIGLIPSNKDYKKFFATSNVSSVITDKYIQPVFYTNKNINVSKNKYQEAIANGNVFIDKNTRLSCKPISAGYVFYTEDLSIINKLLRQLAIINEQLQEENELIAYENKLKARKAKIVHQNRIYSKIFDVCADTINLINGNLETIDKNNDKEFKQCLHIACVYLAYVKRRSNLEIISSQHKSIDICEISFSIKESLSYLSDCGITTSFIGISDIKVDSRIAILLYDFFHECVKSSLPTLSNLLVKISIDENNLFVRLVSSNAFSSISKFKNETLYELNGKIDIVNEDDCLYQSLSFKLKEKKV